MSLNIIVKFEWMRLYVHLNALYWSHNPSHKGAFIGMNVQFRKPDAMKHKGLITVDKCSIRID